MGKQKNGNEGEQNRGDIVGGRNRGASHKGEVINKWDSESMKGALAEWQNQRGKAEHEHIGIRQLSRAWMVPYATLRRRIFSPRENASHKHQSGRPTILSKDAEAELATHIRSLAAAGFPLTRHEIRTLAYEYAVANGVTGFSDKSRGAGYYWLEGFMKRHPELSVKKAENLSVARAMAMNKPQVKTWFQKLHHVLQNLGTKDVPSHMWNTDETGCQNIHKADKVVGEVGVSTYNITALEKGETSTVLVTINAVGQTSPPMIIHKGRKIGKGWSDGAKRGTTIRVSKNGWINKDLFLDHGKQFIKFLKEEKLDDGRPHILVLDQHYSHLYNLEFLELMKANNVHVFSLPSHTSHWLQPLDRGVFKSFKTAWQQEMRLFTRATAGRKLEKKDFFVVFNMAWEKSMTVENAQGGFRGSGLFPYNPNVIPDEAFAPSTTTDRPFTPRNTLEGDMSTHRPTDLKSTASTTIPANEQSMTKMTSQGVVQTYENGADPHSAGQYNISADSPTFQTLLPVVFQNNTVDQGMLPVDQQAVLQFTMPSDPKHNTGPADPQTVVQSISFEGELPAAQTDSVTFGSNVKSVQFKDLMPLPHRERNAPKRPREKPPSYELTSCETIAFISRKLAQKKKQPTHKSKPVVKASEPSTLTKNRKISYNKSQVSKEHNKCILCEYTYGDSEDPLIRDEWFSCSGCSRWWHDTCCLASGKLINGTFKCDDCIKNDC